jgi:hypothetical protein
VSGVHLISLTCSALSFIMCCWSVACSHAMTKDAKSKACGVNCGSVKCSSFRTRVLPSHSFCVVVIIVVLVVDTQSPRPTNRTSLPLSLLTFLHSLSSLSSIHSLQRYAMAKDAESKANQAQFSSKSVGGPLDLDNIFTALAKDASSADASGGGPAGSSLEADLDALLSSGAVERGGTVSIKKGDGVKTIRRKKRIEQKVAEVEAEDGAVGGTHDDEQFNPADYPLIEYADKFFNDWPRK